METKNDPPIEHDNGEWTKMNDIHDEALNILSPMIMKSPKIYLTPLPAFLDFFFH